MDHGAAADASLTCWDPVATPILPLHTPMPSSFSSSWKLQEYDFDKVYPSSNDGVTDASVPTALLFAAFKPKHAQRFFRNLVSFIFDYYFTFPSL